MEPFTVEIAGTLIAVQPMFASTREYCKGYLTDKTADFHVTVTRDDLTFEQAQLEKEALEQGIRPRKFPEPFLERAAILRKTAEFLLGQGILLIHGSTVAVDGAAYLFTAPCGTGKSTHTRLWRQIFGDRAVMINDDKAFLLIGEEGVIACGSPWSGKHGLDTNVQLPLKGICVLSRGMENRLSKVSRPDGLEMLRQQLLGYRSDNDLAAAYELLDDVCRQILLWHLECNQAPDAALVSYEGMSGGLSLPVEI